MIGQFKSVDHILYGKSLPSSRPQINLPPEAKNLSPQMLDLDQNYYENVEGWSGNDKWLARFSFLPSYWLTQTSTFNSSLNLRADYFINQIDWRQEWAANRITAVTSFITPRSSDDLLLQCNDSYYNFHYSQAINFLFPASEHQWLIHKPSQVLLRYPFRLQNRFQPSALIWSDITKVKNSITR